MYFVKIGQLFHQSATVLRIVFSELGDSILALEVSSVLSRFTSDILNLMNFEVALENNFNLITLDLS